MHRREVVEGEARLQDGQHALGHLVGALGHAAGGVAVLVHAQLGGALELDVVGEEPFQDGLGLVQAQADAQAHEPRDVLQPGHPVLVVVDLPLGQAEVEADAHGVEQEEGAVGEQQGARRGAGPDDHARDHEDGQEHHQHVIAVGRQVEPAFGLGVEALLAQQDGLHHLADHLGVALGPPVLLALEGVHFHGQFGRHHHVLQVDPPPALELGPVAQVRVLGDGVVLPAARVGDGAHPPHAGGAGEIEEGVGPVPGGVLEDEMAVQEDGLDLGQEGEVPVQVVPAALDEGDPGIGEMGHRLAQEVPGGQEVGVEHGHELALGRLQAVLQGPGLVAGAVGAVQVGDVEAEGPVLGAHRLGHLDGLVRGVVQHLDLQLVLGPVHAHHVVQQALHHVHFVEHRQLHRHHGEKIRPALRGRRVVLVAEVEEQHPKPMSTINAQNTQDREVGPQHDRLDHVHLKISSAACPSRKQDYIIRFCQGMDE